MRLGALLSPLVGGLRGLLNPLLLAVLLGVAALFFLGVGFLALLFSSPLSFFFFSGTSGSNSSRKLTGERADKMTAPRPADPTAKGISLKVSASTLKTFALTVYDNATTTTVIITTMAARDNIALI